MAPYISKCQRVGLALTLYLCASEARKEETRKKRKWVKRRLKDCLAPTHLNLMNRLDFDEIRNIMRMEKETFYELLEMVRPLIAKQDTNMRLAVSAEERLTATLKFLATGRHYRDLRCSSILSHQLLSKMIPETCRAIYKVLKKTIELPSMEEEWKRIAQSFETQWQFNNCVGCVEGRHILIVKPPGSGSLYYNYKGTFSVVLFAIINANYEFIYVHTGMNGSTPDEDIMKNTSFYEKLVNNALHFPESCVLPGTDISVPYVFLGDNAFELDTHIMNSFTARNFQTENNRKLTEKENIFNYRLNRARKTAEKAFGILGSRFKIFSHPINLSSENVNAVILASCVLHNFLRNKSKTYLTPVSEDVENNSIWRQETGQFIPLERKNQTGSHNGEQIRNILTEYFNGVGGLVDIIVGI